MTGFEDGPPWMAAWLEAQTALARAAGLPVTGVSPASADAQMRLAADAGDFAGVAAALWAAWQTGGLAEEALHGPLLERYRRWFTPIGPSAAAPELGQAGAALLRAQRATERCARLASEIAVDAGRRLVAALESAGPHAPPIASLRELHALWIECGEAAWSHAAHGEEFGAAQAELLAALIELRAGAAAR